MDGEAGTFSIQCHFILIGFPVPSCSCSWLPLGQFMAIGYFSLDTGHHFPLYVYGEGFIFLPITGPITGPANGLYKCVVYETDNFEILHVFFG